MTQRRTKTILWLLVFCMVLLSLAAVAKVAEDVVAERPMLPPGQMWIFQVLFLAAQLLMYGGLVSVLAILIRRLLLRTRFVPQGRWTRSIMAPAGAFLVFLPIAGAFLWTVNQPNGARLMMYGALLLLLVFFFGGFVRSVRDRMQAWLGRALMVSGVVFLIGTAASAGMFDWILGLPSQHLRNRDWANRPGTLTQVGQVAPEMVEGPEREGRGQVRPPENAIEMPKVAAV